MSLDEFPHIAAWLERIETRPGVLAGLKVPEQDTLTLTKKDPELAATTAKEGRAWVRFRCVRDAIEAHIFTGSTDHEGSCRQCRPKEVK